MTNENLTLSDVIIRFVDFSFREGNELEQVKNYKSLIKFMSDNNIPFDLEPDDFEKLLENEKITKMLDSILKLQDNKLYFKNPLFYGLALLYSNASDIKIDIDEEDDYVNEELEEEQDVIYDSSFVTEDPVKQYLKDLDKAPYTPEEELKAFKELSEGNEAKKEEIVEHNLRLVLSIAKRYVGRGLDFLDLVQEGNIGLMTAVDKFKYEKGYKFSTYATWWIRQAITRGLSNGSRTIRIPVHLYECIFKVEKFINGYFNSHNGEKPTYREIQEATGFSIEKVEDIIKYSGKPVSLNSPIGEGEDRDGELGDFIADDSYEDPAEIIYYKQFRDAFFTSNLSQRELLVLSLRFGLKLDEDSELWDYVHYCKKVMMEKGKDPAIIDYMMNQLQNGKSYTLEEVGKVFGVTRERVRQIEAKGLRKLRNPRSKVKQFDPDPSRKLSRAY